MKKYFVFLVIAVMMTACSKDATEEMLGGGSDNGKAANSVLQVTTRSGGEATISYPVQVYVFKGERLRVGEQSSGIECKAVQTIGDAGQTLNIALTEGTYSVYAVGGASATDYTLPAKEDATVTTAMTLKEGRSMTDLMAASATATLIDGGTNTVTLGLQRKVMLIQDVTINKVPTAATAVSVTIAPLWTALTVGGTYSTAGASQTIALTKQSDNRTWTNAQPLPSPTGAGSVPAVGSIYQTCYVLSVTDNGDNADVVLLSPSEVTMGDSYDNIVMLAYTDEEKAATVAAAVDAKIAEADVDAISDWRLPTSAELSAIYAARESINAALDTDVDATKNYLFTVAGGAVRYRALSASGEGAADFGATARVRPVVTVTIAKE